MMWWVALFFLQLQQRTEPAVDTNPYTSATDIAQGKKLYAGRCAGCHGPLGDGGKGTNLAVALLPRATDDRSLYQVIRYGIPDTEMPVHLMTPREVWQVASFVRTLGKVQREPISGNAERGRQLVAGKGGCLQCHTIGLDGGRMGPALTDVGARRGPAHLRDKLLDASSEIPDQFRIVKLTTKIGKNVSGVRLNEDTWSIQIRDFSGGIQSFWKEDLKELSVEHKTMMPSYRDRLGAQEVNDIVAYLAGLRGAE
jgi:cytochrome c oxidase cbb3-type subunit 3